MLVVGIYRYKKEKLGPKKGITIYSIRLNIQKPFEGCDICIRYHSFLATTI